MAKKRGVSVGVEITGDAKGFEQASGDARKATEKLQRGGKRSSKGLQASFRKINAAIGPIAIAIGAIVVAFRTLRNIVAGSIGGQERLARVTGYLSGIMDGLKDIAIDVSEWLAKAFESPKESVKDLWNTIKNFFVTPFEGMVEMVTAGWEIISQGAKGVGLAIAGIFKKDLREASKEAFADMRKGMEDFVEGAAKTVKPIVDIYKGISDVAKEINERGKENADLAEREIKLRQRIANESVKIRRLEADISKYRRIANDDSQELTDQIQAQEKAMKVIEKRFDIQEAQAKEALAIQKERMALGHDTIEDVEKLRQLEADLVGLQSQRDNQMRTLLLRYTTLRNRVDAIGEAEKKAAEEALKAREDILEKIEEHYMTEAELLDKRMQEMIDAHQWSEEEKLRIAEYFADKRNALLEKEGEVAKTVAESMRDGYTDALMDISAGFNQMAMAGRMSAKDVLRQIASTVTGLLIQSIMSSGLPLLAKLGMSAGASAIAGGLMSQIPAFAGGALAYGPVIAQIGDNPGAHHDPEVVSPLSKLRGMMGGRKISIQLEGAVVRGRDILLSAKRAIEQENAIT